MDITNFTLDDFDNLSIYDLRDVAAFLGISSPTTFSKRQLVDLAYLAKSGKLPESKSTTRGRPSKPPKNEYVLRQINTPVNFDNDDDVFLVSEPARLILKETHNGFPSVEDNSANTDYTINSNNFDCCGFLEIYPDGFGFIRCNKVKPGIHDVYVSAKQIKSIKLRHGDYIVACAKQNYENKTPALVSLISVNGMTNQEFEVRKFFDNLNPKRPYKRFLLDSNESSLPLRSVDLIAPIAQGQRAIIVGKANSGKTTLLKCLAENMNKNNANIKLIAILINICPEELSDFDNFENMEIFSTTFDESNELVVKTAEMGIECAKRHAEMGKDVVVLLDDITNLAFGYNNIFSLNKFVSEEVYIDTLHSIRKILSSARCFEEGGSLTLISTANKSENLFNETILKDILYFSNCKIFINSDEKFLDIDLKKSSTDFAEAFLSKETFILYKKYCNALKNNENFYKQYYNLMQNTSCNHMFLEKIINFLK